ncbi:hypothetical protein [Erwinia sp. HR93]|uniref:hypothetical protein n=1 Tax=Erwinia sp. HR93 TaxID=3094840 RepID=UPI002ADECC5B|nr:hypothetical protein [Erwinia sp. HR93]MEA1063195.1 hypothetical protein [Erwinia sp. HR93]
MALESGKRKAESGKRKAESGKRKAESGKRKAESGKRKAESGVTVDGSNHCYPCMPQPLRLGGTYDKICSGSQNGGDLARVLILKPVGIVEHYRL